MKKERMIAMILKPNSVFWGTGSGISANSGAQKVQNRAAKLQKPRVVVPYTVGNSSKWLNQSVNNVPTMP